MFVWHEWTTNNYGASCWTKLYMLCCCCMHASRWNLADIAHSSLSEFPDATLPIISSQNQNTLEKTHHCRLAMRDKCAWRLRDQGRGPWESRLKWRGSHQRWRSRASCRCTRTMARPASSCLIDFMMGKKNWRYWMWVCCYIWCMGMCLCKGESSKRLMSQQRNELGRGSGVKKEERARGDRCGGACWGQYL